MRLGQLSRKLELSTSKIVTFIEKEFEVTLENHPNTKIDDSFLEKIETEFKVEVPEPIVEATEKVAEVKEEIPLVIEKVETVIEKAPVIEDEKTPIIEVKSEEPSLVEEKEVELIKAPKPELKQIKVLRKIELPTKKVVAKDLVEEEISSNPKTTAKDIENLEKELQASINKPTPLKKKESAYKRPNKPMKKTKSVDEVLAEKKKRAEVERLAEEKKQKEREEYERKRKKEHYSAQLAKTQTTKKKKKKKVVIEEVSSKKKQVQEQPKSWIGKLIHWFQTS